MNVPRKISDKDASILQGMQKDVVRWRKNEGPKGTYPTTPDTFQGALLAEVVSENGIPAATAAKVTGRGRIRLRTLWFRDDDLTSSDMDIVGPADKPVLWNEVADEFTEADCYNISQVQSWAFGDVLAVLPLAAGRFLAMGGAGGVELFHGVIVSPCDPVCNTYRVQRVHRYLLAECDDCDTGTGSTGTGTA